MRRKPEVDITEDWFLEWERNQVADYRYVSDSREADLKLYGEYLVHYRYHRGPSSPRTGSVGYAGEMFSVKGTTYATESEDTMPFRAMEFRGTVVPEEQWKEMIL